MPFPKGSVPWNKGLIYNEELKSQLNTSGLAFGRGYFKGKRFSQEYKEKLSLAHKGVQADERHPLWQGDNVGYRALHKWVQNKLGKAKECIKCKILGLKRYHWANLSGLYKRNVMDYIALCPKCHRQFDKGGGLL